jgi:hypothetical protein
MSKIPMLLTLLALICACQGEPEAPEGSRSTRTVGDQTEFTVAGCCTLVLPRGFRPMEWNGIDTKGAIFENDEARVHVEYDVEPGIAINTSAQQHQSEEGKVDGRPARLYTYSGGETASENLLASATIYTKGRERQTGARVIELRYVCKQGTGCRGFQQILERLQVQS